MYINYWNVINKNIRLVQKVLDLKHFKKSLFLNLKAKKNVLLSNLDFSFNAT